MIGSFLSTKIKFDKCFNSSNISEISNYDFNTVVCCGVRGVKWRAIQNPEEDLLEIKKLVHSLRSLHSKRLILFSTIEVIPKNIYISEERIFSDIEDESNNAYGKNRSFLEKEVSQIMEENNIELILIRLPILFGEGITRNFIFDFINDEKIILNENSRFSFCAMEDIVGVILPLLENSLSSKRKIINLFSESLSGLEVYNILSKYSGNVEINSISHLREYPLVEKSDLKREKIIEGLNLFIESSFINRKVNVLITGGCGFIGSNFINYLLRTYPNYIIHNIDKMSYCSNHNNISLKDEGRYFFYKIDLSEGVEEITRILEENRIDYIIHFAAQSHVDSSFDNSKQNIIDNVIGTENLLKSCVIYNKIKKILHISTDEVYGESDLSTSVKKREGDSLFPTNPYSASKAAAEMIVHSYQNSFKLPIIITRGNNVYGPNQYPEKVIPKFILSLLRGEKCTIHGKGKTVRHFLFVSDVCRAINTVLMRGKINDIYNISGEEEYSVIEVLEKITQKLHIKNIEDCIEYIQDRKFNDKRYYICNEKLLSLGWRPEISFSYGLDLTIRWMSENMSRYV